MTASKDFFTARLAEVDPAMADCLDGETGRQRNQIELIASENTVSRAVLEALGSCITNKTLEGYPGNRFHGGAEFMDIAESLAIERAKRLFDCRFANVQPHSGSQANLSVFLSLLDPGDKILSMDLAAGGHLSHGAKANLSGKWFDPRYYGVDPEEGLLDYDEVEALALEHTPKLIIAGGSAYPRAIDFKRFRAVADQVGASLLVDMAHFAGLVAAKVHESPLPYADVVTCTTTKTLRGPRGGVILSNHVELGRKIDSAVFPGAQGSLHSQIIAAKAVCFHEALTEEFCDYGARVIANARTLAETLQQRGFKIWGNGTDTHLVLIDVSSQGLLGSAAQIALERVGITSNKNPTPIDPAKPAEWTGIRLGSSAGTTRGFDENTFQTIGHLIADVLENVSSEIVQNKTTSAVRDICASFPIYP